MYGGQRPDLTNVIFTNGDIDPWHSLSVLEDLNDYSPAILINGNQTRTYRETSKLRIYCTITRKKRESSRLPFMCRFVIRIFALSRSLQWHSHGCGGLEESQSEGPWYNRQMALLVRKVSHRGGFWARAMNTTRFTLLSNTSIVIRLQKLFTIFEILMYVRHTLQWT